MGPVPRPRLAGLENETLQFVHVGEIPVHYLGHITGL